jgi:hypothetical protein
MSAANESTCCASPKPWTFERHIFAIVRLGGPEPLVSKRAASGALPASPFQIISADGNLWLNPDQKRRRISGSRKETGS